MNASASRKRVAFQGERGAFSEEAAVKLLGREIELVPRPTFKALFAAVSGGAADGALAPVENTLAGSVQQVYDLLLDSPLDIKGEVVIPVEHCLIGCPGAKFAAIRAVESHPVALAQCERFFAAHTEIRRVVSEDTAGSAADVIRRGDPTRAAIASRRAASLYGGHILREHLEDDRENYTRFLLLAPTAEAADAAAAGADKLSLVAGLPHEPGSLQRALAPFARRGIDLLKIECRPVRGRPWQYHFFLDLRASPNDDGARVALAELRERAPTVRVLGWYVSAQQAGAD